MTRRRKGGTLEGQRGMAARDAKCAVGSLPREAQTAFGDGESETKFQALIETTSDFIWEMDADGRYTYCSPQMERLWGFKPEAMLGKTPFDMMRDEERGAAQASFAQFVRAPQPFTGMHLTTRDGRGGLVHIEVSGVPFFDKAGTLLGFRGVTRDITERKRAEEEHQRAQERLQVDLEAMTRLQTLGSLFVREGDLESVLGEIVDAAIAISGADFGNIQLLDSRTSELHIVAHRGFPQWWLDFWAGVAHGKGVCGTALERGERVIVEDVERSPMFIGTPALEVQLRAGVRAVQSTPLVSRSGKPLGTFSTHYRSPGRPEERTLRLLDLLARQTADIIERSQIEAALRQSEEKYRSLFANLVEEVHFWQLLRDEAGHIRTWRLVDANPPALKTWGGKRGEEIRGKTADEIFGPGATEHHMPVVQKIMTEGTSHSFEDYFPNLDKYFQFTSIPLGGEHFITTGADISGIRRVTRLYEVLSRVNETIVRTHDEQSLFDEVCKIITDVGGFPLAWIGMVRGREIRPVAGGGPAAKYLESMRVEIDGELGNGPSGTAVRDGRAVINDDFDVNPATAPWRAAALEYGFRASASFPLRSQGSVIGSLTLYSVRPGAFDEPHVKLLDSLSSDLSYALDALAQERRRKEAEEALRRNQEEYRRLVETSGSVILRVDKEMRITFMNQHGLRFFGYTPGEILGRKALGSIVPVRDDAGHDAGAMAEDILRHPDNYQTKVHQNMRKDGSLVWMAWTNRPICDEEGNLIELLSIGNDLTQLKQAEEALRQSEERFRVAQELSPDGFSILEPVRDTQGRVVDFTCLYVNPALERMTGLPQSALQGGSLRGLPDQRGLPFFEAYQQVAETGQTRVLESPAHGFLGGRWFRLAIVPIGQNIAVLSQDITERKQAEEDLREANQQLAETDRRKNEFLAVLSHELRNPLAPISNSLYILDHAPPGGQQAERARQVIGRQVAQLSNLVNDLLDITRITRDKVHLQKERLDLREIVRRAVEDNRSFFDRAGVHVELAPAVHPLPVIGDPTRITQIIGNLLQNAAKFTTRGGWARVFLAAEADDAVVRIADNGVGISPETLGRLFQPFMQAPQTLERSKGGLGLGLALVKGLVELHGGTISAHSEGLGTGTEFTVRLPLDRGPALGAPVASSRTARARRRILLIEDNVEAAESLSEALRFEEHEVGVAHDGPEGIAKARVFRPDVVFCDIGLPGMNGYEVARTFRADETLKAAFLVALTGYALPEDLQRAAEAGFDRHLPKPPSMQAIEEMLGGSEAGAPAGRASA